MGSEGRADEQRPAAAGELGERSEEGEHHEGGDDDSLHAHRTRRADEIFP